MATFVIAEVGVNHNGDIGLAKKLVEAASKAGANAVKFQTFKADDLATATAPKAEYQIENDGSGSQIEMLKSLELTVSEHRELAEYCKAWDIMFLSTAFGVNELDFLLELGMTAIKVPSGEITNLLLLAGKRVVVIDDSIVRGTTSRKLVAAIRDAGATEVHMRISSPPVTHPCFYGIDTDTQDQLIAARLTLEEISAHLGVDSLAYLSKEGMVEAAQANAEHFCTACFDGAYPIEMDSSVSGSKLMLEPAGIAKNLRTEKI